MSNDWRLIKTTELPTKRRGTTPIMQRSLEIVSALKPGFAAEVPIADGMTMRGQKGSLSKAAKTLGVQIDFIDGDGVVYVQLVDGK